MLHNILSQLFQDIDKVLRDIEECDKLIQKVPDAPDSSQELHLWQLDLSAYRAAIITKRNFLKGILEDPSLSESHREDSVEQKSEELARAFLRARSLCQKVMSRLKVEELNIKEAPGLPRGFVILDSKLEAKVIAGAQYYPVFYVPMGRIPLRFEGAR